MREPTQLCKEDEQQFLVEIDAGHYTGYVARTVNHVRYHASKDDGDEGNNLG